MQCQYTLHPYLPWRGTTCPPPAPLSPSLSDIFTVKEMILDTRNEKAPVWPVASVITQMNWTMKPWHFKETYLEPCDKLSWKNIDVFGAHPDNRLPKCHGRAGGWEWDRWVGRSAGPDEAATEATGLLAQSGVTVLGQEPLLVMYSETKLP